MSILMLRTPPVPAALTAYSTLFPLTENPVSEGAIWYRNQSNGFTNLRTANGTLMATNGPEDLYDDSYAYLKNWAGGNDYTITATIDRNAALNTSATHETAIQIRMNDDDPSIVHSVECLFSHQGDAIPVLWSGAAGPDFFSILPFTGPGGKGGPILDGDLIKATVSGSTLVLYINNVVMATVTSGVPASGKPGHSAFMRPTSNPAHFRIRSWSVTVP